MITDDVLSAAVRGFRFDSLYFLLNLYNNVHTQKTYSETYKHRFDSPPVLAAPPSSPSLPGSKIRNEEGSFPQRKTTRYSSQWPLAITNRFQRPLRPSTQEPHRQKLLL